MQIFLVAVGGFGNMEIIKVVANQQLAPIPQIAGTHVACIGYFDGIHKGHQALIETTLKLAGDKHIPSVICFDKDPHLLLHKVKEPRYITPYEERLHVLASYGIKRCFLLHFDEAMMRMDKEYFIKYILEQLHLKALVCGEDFRFAYEGKGNCDSLLNRSFQLHIVSEKRYHNQKISSSTIEQFIMEGKMQEVYEQLGRYYAIKGHVIHGAHVGSTKLGFPTANLKMEENYIIPKKGVYYGSVHVNDKTYKAMINVGNNPTMNYQRNTSIEAHIIDFDENIYGQKIIFYFHVFMREEKKFHSLDELIEQLEKDIAYVRSL